MENGFVYIWSGEHKAYWRPDSRGYTTRIENAGEFAHSYAVHFTGPAYADKLIKLIPVAPEYLI